MGLLYCVYFKSKTASQNIGALIPEFLTSEVVASYLCKSTTFYWNIVALYLRWWSYSLLGQCCVSYRNVYVGPLCFPLCFPNFLWPFRLVWREFQLLKKWLYPTLHDTTLPDDEKKKHAPLIQDKYWRLIHWSVFLKKDWNFKLDPSQLKSTEKLRILWNTVIKNILNVYKSDTQSTIFTRSRFSKLHYTCERLMLTMGHWHYCLLPLLKFIILIIKTDWRFLSFFFCYFS